MNTIIHLSHSYGGGTEVYINNLLQIYDLQYINKYFIFNNNKIISKLENKRIEYTNILNLLTDKTILITHYPIIKYHNNYLNFYNSNCKKYIIIHDSTWLENNYIYNIIDNIDKIIFNSYYSYNSYPEEIKKKSIILNNVPDIKISNIIRYPLVKQNINIGIVGRVGSERKGKNIIIKIFNLLNNNNYKFFVFGSNSFIKHSNITFTGLYDNKNIYKLINNNNIDLFLFTSVVDETYSYVLSILMNTGLPIIYYDKGCISERLSNRTNCFKFTECNEVNDIIDNIKNNLITYNSKTKYLYELNKYNCEYNYLFNMEQKIIIDDLYDHYNNILILTIINDLNNTNNDDEKLKIKINNLIEDYDKCYILLIGKHIKFNNKITLSFYNKKINTENILKCSSFKINNIKFNINYNLIYNYNCKYIYLKDIVTGDINDELTNNELINNDKLISNDILYEKINDDDIIDKENIYNNINNYINIKNFNKAIRISKLPENIIENKELIDILINIKNSNFNLNQKNILFFSECIYPPAGGGEHWILDSADILNNSNNILICFKDNFINKNFKSYNLIFHNNNYIIQLKYNLLDILTIINFFNIKIVIHQGHIRKEIIEIAKVLNLNLLTFFAFWNDLITYNNNNNINMINNKYNQTQLFLENYNQVHFIGVSKFVNNICNNTYNKNIEVIESISKIDNNILLNEGKYVTFLNSNELKGGYELLYLLNNLDINIPIYTILTNNKSLFDNKIIQAFRIRNHKNNINKYFLQKQSMNEIYKKCKIMMILSSVDETFCRVAYESIILNKMVINYNNGNLKYIFNNYKNNFNLNLDLDKLKNNINLGKKINNTNCSKYPDIKKLIEDNYFKETNEIYNKKLYDNNILNIKLKYNKLINAPKLISNNKKTIGILGPFIDQGLGIQLREYYTFLKNNNYDVIIYNHKTNHSIASNNSEWKNYNVFNSKYLRDKITLEELFNFCIIYNIKIMIIPELSKYEYKIIKYLKLLNVKVITPINIECLQYNQFNNLNLVDTIITNNKSSYYILKKIFNDKVKLLEFNNYYLKKNNKINNFNDPINFCCFGGVNSFYRKNIDKIYNTFYKLEQQNFKFNLNIYIQIEANKKKLLKLKNTNNIKIIIKNTSYNEVINNINNNDIIIHLGDHEGLGLGFYEALNNNKICITLNTYPNNEIIKHKENGFLIDCEWEPLIDNKFGIINKAKIIESNIENIIKYILDPNNNKEIDDIRIKNKNINNEYKNNFINILNEFF